MDLEVASKLGQEAVRRWRAQLEYALPFPPSYDNLADLRDREEAATFVSAFVPCRARGPIPDRAIKDKDELPRYQALCEGLNEQDFFPSFSKSTQAMQAVVDKTKDLGKGALRDSPTWHLFQSVLDKHAAFLNSSGNVPRSPPSSQEKRFDVSCSVIVRPTPDESNLLLTCCGDLLHRLPTAERAVLTPFLKFARDKMGRVASLLLSLEELLKLVEHNISDLHEYASAILEVSIQFAVPSFRIHMPFSLSRRALRLHLPPCDCSPCEVSNTVASHASHDAHLLTQRSWFL